MPISNQSKGYPFELALPKFCQTTGVALCDQVRSLDWKARKAILKENAGKKFTRGVLARVMPLVTWRHLLRPTGEDADSKIFP